MSFSSALKPLAAASLQSPQLAMPLRFHPGAVRLPAAHQQTQRVACPAAAREPLGNAPCSPHPYRATTCSPYSSASPTTKHCSSPPSCALHPQLFPATQATLAPASHHPQPHCSAEISARSIWTTPRLLETKLACKNKSA